jgi:hypothetical protein
MVIYVNNINKYFEVNNFLIFSSMEIDGSQQSSSYSSPPWLGVVKDFSPTKIFAFPITFPLSLPLHSGGAWLWG